MRLTLSVRAIRRRMSGDHGSSLVAVIGTSAVIAIMLVVLVGTVVFAVGQATASRAGVSAKSAAEAGMETVAAYVSGGACPAGGAASSTAPRWHAQVQSLVSATADPALDTSWVNGCPMAAPADATVGTLFRVIATGHTGSPGAGNATENVRTMVGQFTVKQRAMSPEFNQAIFGKTSTSASTNLVINGSDGDVLTDTFNCSTNGDISGGVYINSSLTESSTLNTSCTIRGDLVTKGNLNCPANGKIGGNVVVAGDVNQWNTTCTATGSMLVGGNFYCPSSATIGGDLTVVGNASISTGCNIGGNVWIGGNLTMPNSWTFPSNVWVKGNLSGSSSTIKSTAGQIRVGGTVSSATLVSTPAPVTHDTTLTKPTAPDMNTWFPPSDPHLVFPKLTTTDARWSGWTARKWVNDMAVIARYSNACSMGDSGFNATPLVITTPTIYDLTASSAAGGCGSSQVGLGGNLTIQLNADAVMFVAGAAFQGPFKVVSGDGAKHSLYVVEPWPSSMTSCSSPPSSVHGINLHAWGSPTLSQDSKSQIMIYTPGTISSSGTVAFTGQMYGCKVDLSNPVNVTFVPATAGSGSSGRSFIVTEKFRMDDQSETLGS